MIKLTNLLNEKIELDVAIGDTILMGKWKNKKVVVKSITKDEYGMPMINGKKVATFRIPKKVNIFDEVVLEEGRYDKITSDASKLIVNLLKKKKKNYEGMITILGNDIDMSITLDYTGKAGNLPYSIWGQTIKYPYGEDTVFEVKFEIYINTILFDKTVWADFIGEIKDTVRHEIEHVTQHFIKSKPRPVATKKKSGTEAVNYLLSKHEIEAFMAGFYKKAKSRKMSMNTVITKFLDDYDTGSTRLTKKEHDKVLDMWIAYGKKKYPNAKWE